MRKELGRTVDRDRGGRPAKARGREAHRRASRRIDLLLRSSPARRFGPEQWRAKTHARVAGFWSMIGARRPARYLAKLADGAAGARLTHEGEGGAER